MSDDAPTAKLMNPLAQAVQDGWASERERPLRPVELFYRGPVDMDAFEKRIQALRENERNEPSRSVNE